jgi:ABC-2 type transport system ATP-binding protein
MTNDVRTSERVEATLVTESLRKTYPDDVVALDGLDLEVAASTIFGLLGPNGAGKSTTVRILTTLSRPDDGSARVAGADVLTEPERVRSAVGYVAQKSGADVQATGTENLMLQARIHGLDRREGQSRAGSLLERLGLAEHADRLVKTWSGGMRRRLDIGLALVNSPQVLFLDEPTTGLDPEARADLWDEIRRLRDEDGVTVLLTTHYLDEADRLADRLAIIDHGRIVAEGTPGELKDGMRGDGVHIELADAELVGRAAPILETVGLHDVITEGGTVHGRVERAAEAIPIVLNALSKAGVDVQEVSVSRPSLDDVFLSHTGRRFLHNGQEVSS